MKSKQLLNIPNDVLIYQECFFLYIIDKLYRLKKDIKYKNLYISLGDIQMKE